MIPHFSVFSVTDRLYVAAAATVSVIAGWGFTGHLGDAFLAGAIGAIVTGLPKIIVALTGSRKSISEIMQKERDTLQEALMDERDTVRLVRISKHNFQNELHKCWFHIDYLEETLKQHQIDFEKITRVPLEILTQFEDTGIARIIERQMRIQKELEQ